MNYSGLTDPKGNYKEIIADFQSIDSKMSAPLVLGISEMFHHDKLISESQFYEIIEIINNYQIRRYFNNDATSRINKIFPTALKNIRNYAEEYGYEHIVDIVIFVLITKNRNNQMALPTDKSLKSNFQMANAYAMRLTRWLLEKIENKDNSAKLDMSSLSIEHIMPQTENEYWTEKAGVSGEEYTEIINTIGNLTLVAKVDNSKAGNLNFDRKKKIFENTLHIKMNKNLYQYTEWNADFIERRSNDIGDKLISMYPYLRSKANYDHNIERNIFINWHNIQASGYLNKDESVTVYAGSQVNIDAEKNNADNLKENRQKLVEEGIVVQTPTSRYFAEDYTFKTPSGAAAFIIGGSKNGWEWWKDIHGTKINESLRVIKEDNK